MTNLLAFMRGRPILPIVISGTPTASSYVGISYNFTPIVTNSIGTLTFSLTGTLPAGLSFNTSTGTIYGVPTTAQVASGLNISVTDSTARSAILGVFSITVTVYTLPSITPSLSFIGGQITGAPAFVTRTGAMASAHWLQEAFIRSTGNVVIGVDCSADPTQALSIGNGIDHVTFWVGGVTATATTPSVYMDVNPRDGSPWARWGWWVQVNMNDSHGGRGNVVRCFATIVPTNVSIQSRVIGWWSGLNGSTGGDAGYATPATDGFANFDTPMFLQPRTAAMGLWDWYATVNTGNSIYTTGTNSVSNVYNYHTLAAAMNAGAAAINASPSTYEGAHISIDVAGAYNLDYPTTVTTTSTTTTRLTASVSGVTLTSNGNVFDPYNTLGIGYQQSSWKVSLSIPMIELYGQNITWDFYASPYVQSPGNWGLVFNGCNLTNSCGSATSNYFNKINSGTATFVNWSSGYPIPCVLKKVTTTYLNMNLSNFRLVDSCTMGSCAIITGEALSCARYTSITYADDTPFYNSINAITIDSTINGATFTGSISGTTLTVSAISAGAIVPGAIISGSGVTVATIVNSQLTGTTGSTGTYSLSASQTVSSTAITSTATLGKTFVGNDALFTINDVNGTVTFQAPFYNNLTSGTATKYNVSNFVTWVNGRTGWAATLLDDTRPAYSLFRNDNGATPTVSVNSTPQTIVVGIGNHSEFAHWHQGENGLMRGMFIYMCWWSTDIINIEQNSGLVCDVHILDSVLHVAEPTSTTGNFMKGSHVFMSNCILDGNPGITDDVTDTYPSDNYTGFWNCCFSTNGYFHNGAGYPTPGHGGRFVNCIGQGNGGNPMPAGVMNVFADRTAWQNSFVNYATSDFRPNSSSYAYLHPAAVSANDPIDMRGNVRSLNDIIGPYSINAAAP